MKLCMDCVWYKKRFLVFVPMCMNKKCRIKKIDYVDGKDVSSYETCLTARKWFCGETNAKYFEPKRKK